MGRRWQWLVAALLLAACGGGDGASSRSVELRDRNGDGQIVILAFGDSITRGQGDGGFSGAIPPGIGGYPGRLQEMLGVPVRNAGQPGEDTSEGIVRLPGVLAGNAGADYVILQEGTLDIEKRRTADAARNLESMVATAQAAGFEVLIGTLLPTCCTHGGIIPNGSVNTLNQEIRGIAERASIRVIEFHDDFLSGENQPYDPSSGLLHPDGLHPTPLGYDVMAATAASAFR